MFMKPRNRGHPCSRLPRSALRTLPRLPRPKPNCVLSICPSHTCPSPQNSSITCYTQPFQARFACPNPLAHWQVMLLPVGPGPFNLSGSVQLKCPALLFCGGPLLHHYPIRAYLQPTTPHHHLWRWEHLLPLGYLGARWELLGNHNPPPSLLLLLCHYLGIHFGARFKIALLSIWEMLCSVLLLFDSLCAF